MATEPDQTRWVGIRPTPDCNDIPAATRKQAPAISDLQAIKEPYSVVAVVHNKDCTVVGEAWCPPIGAGEIVVVTSISAANETSLCDILIRPSIIAQRQIIKSGHSVEPGIEVSWVGMLVLVEDDRIYVHFELGGALDSVKIYVAGYKTGVY